MSPWIDKMFTPHGHCCCGTPVILFGLRPSHIQDDSSFVRTVWLVNNHPSILGWEHHPTFVHCVLVHVS